jgi:hypothetical protein
MSPPLARLRLIEYNAAQDFPNWDMAVTDLGDMRQSSGGLFALAILKFLDKSLLRGYNSP